LKDEHQQAVQQQDRELVAALARMSQVGNCLQSFEQSGQLAAQDAQLPADGLLARLLLLEDRRIGRAGVGQRRGSPRAASFGELALAKSFVLLFFLRRCSLMASR
jgi:hypothetical protein